MNRLLMTSLAAVGAVLAIAGGASATLAKPAATPATYRGHRLAAHAKFSIAQAQAIALKARPGKVTDKELEKEAGGSGLRYSFDVAGADGVAYEVGVDARSGAVLENAREGAHPD